MTTLDALLGAEAAASVRKRLNAANFRRLSGQPEQTISPNLLCQSLHLDRLEGEPRPLLGEGSGTYYMHSVESAKPVLDELRSHGIRRAYIGTDGKLGLGEATYEERLGRFTEIVAAMRQAAGPDMELIVDPAGLCMRKDLRWGVSRADGGLDAEATLALLGRAAFEFGQAGADSLLTIGRVNCEVEVARAALSKLSRHVSILSFSTNSETTSAYFDVTRHDITNSRTGQKMFVGNGTEMLIRAIADFGEGSDVIVQKPVEASHLLVTLRLLATGQLPLSAFIEGTPRLVDLLNDNPTIRPAFERGTALVASGQRPLKTGTYEVSGTYSTIRLLAQTYNEELAWSLLDELLQNAASAAGDTLDVIISRGALWYARIQKQLERKRSAA